MTPEERDLAEEAEQKLQEARATLRSQAGSAETQADDLIKIIEDLEALRKQLPDDLALRVELDRAKTRALVLRDQLWQDSRELLKTKSVGLTLGGRRRRAQTGVRLLQKAEKLDYENLPALEDELAKATYRLSYLESARDTARAERGRRLGIFAIIGIVIVGALLWACFALELVAVPSFIAGAPQAATSTPGPATEPTVQPAHTAAPAPVNTAMPSVVHTATPASPQPTTTAALMPSDAAQSLPSDTAAPTPSDTAQPTPTDTATALTLPSDTPTLAPSPTPLPTVEDTSTPAPTLAPTRTPAPRPTATRTTSSPALSPTTPPTQAYPAPILIEPSDLSLLSQGTFSTYPLQWQWEGALQADEWFDIRVWREGLPHYGIAWTKQQRYLYDLCLQGNGGFLWSVAVIRGEEGLWQQDLSPEATPLRFTSSRQDEWCTEHGRLTLPARIGPQ